MDLSFKLHPAQMQIFTCDRRFIVCAAGRRFGKSHVSAVKLLTEGLKERNEHGYDLMNKDVFYVAPTFPQGKDIMWRLLKSLGAEVITSTVENTGVITLINGRRIHIKGSDRPDTLRGVGLSYVVLDEYASMKPETWDQILRPTLSDVKGGALFIGTPAGKNHFFELYSQALDLPDWGVFSFTSRDNPFLDPDEVEAARTSMSFESYRQEYEASFSSGSGKIFVDGEFVKAEEPAIGDYYIAVDLAGFADVAEANTSKLRRLDESAIAIVKVSPAGWWVKDIVHGRWDVRETSVRILREAQKVRPVAIGIEKGALHNAIQPYLHDQMRRIGVFPRIMDVSHGGQRKIDRITWALQGRLQHGKLTFNEGEYLKHLVGQAMDFPNPLAHDDLLDALAYIDQIARVIYTSDIDGEDEWRPLDAVSGY